MMYANHILIVQSNISSLTNCSEKIQDTKPPHTLVLQKAESVLQI